MLKNIEEVKKAKKQVVDGSLTIWNARLDAFVQAGDLKSTLDQLITSCDGDNCDCQCGAAMLPYEILSMGIEAKKGRK